MNKGTKRRNELLRQQKPSFVNSVLLAEAFKISATFPTNTLSFESGFKYQYHTKSNSFTRNSRYNPCDQQRMDVPFRISKCFVHKESRSIRISVRRNIIQTKRKIKKRCLIKQVAIKSNKRKTKM